VKKWLLFGLIALVGALGWLYAARYELAGWVFLPSEEVRAADYRVCVEHGVAMTAPDGSCCGPTFTGPARSSRLRPFWSGFRSAAA
jgi:hypothetical protein